MDKIIERQQQIQKIVARFAFVINEVKLSREQMELLITNKEEFCEKAKKLVLELSISNQFVDEEVESSHSYPSGYQPKLITEQVTCLCKLFPELGSFDEKIAEQPLPISSEGKSAEEYFAIPRWEKIAPTYGEAVQKVLDLIKQTRNGKFRNYCEGKLGPQYLRQHAKTAKTFQVIGDEQEDYDILVIPAQFGLNHRGKSDRWAREVMSASEFGLGAFATGIMILTHPERLQHYEDLWIDCIGDKCAPGADGGFSRAPCFRFVDGEVGFGTDRIDDPDGSYGSVSGFVPQF